MIIFNKKGIVMEQIKSVIHGVIVVAVKDLNRAKDFLKIKWTKYCLVDIKLLKKRQKQEIYLMILELVELVEY